MFWARRLDLRKNGDGPVIAFEGRVTARAVAVRSWRSLRGAFRAMPFLLLLTLILGAALAAGAGAYYVSQTRKKKKAAATGATASPKSEKDT